MTASRDICRTQLVPNEAATAMAQNESKKMKIGRVMIRWGSWKMELFSDVFGATAGHEVFAAKFEQESVATHGNMM